MAGRRIEVAGDRRSGWLLAAVACVRLVAGSAAGGQETRPDAPLPRVEPTIDRVVIDDGFWAPRMKLWREVTIPDCLDKFERDGTLANFDRVRDGQLDAPHGGLPWFDGLLYEMIRASADFLAAHPDPVLEARLDAAIERIADAAAKDPNGYVNTYTQLKEPNHRWGQNGGDDRQQHDLYNAGALVEAGVHDYQATGKTRLLEVATRLANHMADLMGPAPKQNIVPGHALGEEALVELYALYRERPELKGRMGVPVDESRYLKLAEFWIENRGHHEGRQDFGEYDQDHEPVLQQQTIVGHAVRAALLWSGVAAASRENHRDDYREAALRIWANMAGARMYVTGGLGAVAKHEGFGGDYELPNDGYLETCASVAAAFFHRNLGLVQPDGRYADELERVLYNGVLAGVSLQGNSYFYENPLETATGRQRWAWHSCPCCPPMFLKLMGTLPRLIYTHDASSLDVNQFIGSRASLDVGTTRVNVRQVTDYPWDETVTLHVEPVEPAEFTLRVRVPGWCGGMRVSVNGEPVGDMAPDHGYLPIRRTWKPGDVVAIDLPMPVTRMTADPRVKADVGRVAIRRGPLIYAFEAIDNGGHLRDLVIGSEATFTPEPRPDLLGGVTVLRGKAAVLGTEGGSSPIEVLAIPYFANANRPNAGPLMVWMAATPEAATRPTVAGLATPSASHVHPTDSLAALNDRREPSASDDASIPRFTWWDHRGSAEWVQLDFDRPRTVSATDVYWWDERRIGAHCRVPQSWRLLYRTADGWKPVATSSEYGTAMDAFNRVTFTPVETTALRIEAQLQPEWSGGVLEWRIE
jgi:DUF1680 family protein